MFRPAGSNEGGVKCEMSRDLVSSYAGASLRNTEGKTNRIGDAPWSVQAPRRGRSRTQRGGHDCAGRCLLFPHTVTTTCLLIVRLCVHTSGVPLARSSALDYGS